MRHWYEECGKNNFGESSSSPRGERLGEKLFFPYSLATKSILKRLETANMPSARSAPEILDRQFLETRARILQIAADLDRLDRAEGTLDGDSRMAKLRQAIEVLLADTPDRAEQVQLIFSREYDRNWKQQFGLESK